MDYYPQAKKELEKQKTKHILVAIILAVILIAVIVGFIAFSDIPDFFLVILIIVFLVFYSVILFFLIEQINTMEVEVERIKVIEKYTTIDNPVLERIEVEKPVIKDIPIPVYIKEKRKIPRGKRYKYIASEEGKLFHYSTSRLSKLIRPKNVIHSDDPKFFIDKGYKPSKRTLRRWKKEEPKLYEKYGSKKKKNKKSKNK
jgi:hypothetical protein